MPGNFLGFVKENERLEPRTRVIDSLRKPPSNVWVVLEHHWLSEGVTDDVDAGGIYRASLMDRQKITGAVSFLFEILTDLKPPPKTKNSRNTNTQGQPYGPPGVRELAPCVRSIPEVCQA